MLNASNLIITSAYGKRFKVPYAFLKSAQQAGVNAHIVFIRHTVDQQFLNECRAIYPSVTLFAQVCNPVVEPLCKVMARMPRFGVSVARFLQVLTSATQPDRIVAHYVALHLLNQMCSRFLIARHLLKQADYLQVEKVLLVDSRDVIFQTDPFAERIANLTNGEEFPLVKDEPSNHSWIHQVYADEPEIFNRLYNGKVLCAGVTIGPRDCILKYLDEMAREIFRKLPRLAFRPGVDQMVHNKVMRTSNALSQSITKNGDRLIANLATTGLSDHTYAFGEGLRNMQGELVSIVHQYDRHAALDSIVPD